MAKIVSFLFRSCLVFFGFLLFSTASYSGKSLYDDCIIKEIKEMKNVKDERLAAALISKKCTNDLSRPLNASELRKLSGEGELSYHIPGRTLLKVTIYNGNENLYISEYTIEVIYLKNGEKLTRKYKDTTAIDAYSSGVSSYFDIGPKEDGTKYRWRVVGAKGY